MCRVWSYNFSTPHGKLLCIPSLLESICHPCHGVVVVAFFSFLSFDFIKEIAVCHILIF